MTRRSLVSMTRVTNVALVLMLSVSAAWPENAYWQGRRSSNWDHGIANGVSNWYTLAPPLGQARAVPDQFDTAILARGSRTASINIPVGVNTIGKLVFTAGAPQYSFKVPDHALLEIVGEGLFNRSTTEPRFTLRAGGEVVCTSQARLFSFTAARPALFYMDPGSGLRFYAGSRGGNAWVGNSGGAVRFFNTTSAERMTLINYSRTEAPFSRIDFHHRSTGGNARFVNQYNSVLNFTQTLGPTGNGRLTVGAIQNYGQLYVGTRIVGVTDSFLQDPTASNGDLHVTIYRQEAGALIVTNRARLGGRLVVNVAEPVPGRPYGIIAANGGRIGKFVEVRTVNVNMPQPHVTYTTNGVVLTFAAP